MADMGIYSLWPVFAALDLGVPVSAQAWATHTCTVADNVSKPVRNDFAYPTGCSIRLTFAARQNLPGIDLFWYDGGMKPRLPDEVEAQDPPMGAEGILFVGDAGAIMAGFNGQNPRLFAKGENKALELAPVPQRDRRTSWVEAFLGGPASPGNFENAAAITDAVNLGTVALRAGRKVIFDSENMKITNVPEADKFLHREYRKGWEL